MPSSSTRSTGQEWLLTYCFRVAYGRLFLESMYREAKAVLNCYTELLDCNDITLASTVDFEGKWWNDMRTSTRQRKRSDNVWSAADCLADTATALTRFGRVCEAGKFSEWAENLYAMAKEEAFYERPEYFG